MYTLDGEGVLNNYAVEPPVYFAQSPSLEQQQQYTFQGAITTLLIVFTVLTAFAVS